MTGRIRDNRLVFEESVGKAVARLPVDSRAALVAMLIEVRALAEANAAESLARKKWAMHAYWKIVAVYAGHLRRMTNRAGVTPPRDGGPR